MLRAATWDCTDFLKEKRTLVQLFLFISALFFYFMLIFSETFMTLFLFALPAIALFIWIVDLFLFLE